MHQRAGQEEEVSPPERPGDALTASPAFPVGRASSRRRRRRPWPGRRLPPRAHRPAQPRPEPPGQEGGAAPPGCRAPRACLRPRCGHGAALTGPARSDRAPAPAPRPAPGPARTPAPAGCCLFLRQRTGPRRPGGQPLGAGRPRADPPPGSRMADDDHYLRGHEQMFHLDTLNPSLFGTELFQPGMPPPTERISFPLCV